MYVLSPLFKILMLLVFLLCMCVALVIFEVFAYFVINVTFFAINLWRSDKSNKNYCGGDFVPVSQVSQPETLCVATESIMHDPQYGCLV